MLTHPTPRPPHSRSASPAWPRHWKTSGDKPDIAALAFEERIAMMIDR